MTKLKREYLRYLESEHWKTLRLEAFERDGFKCIKCGSKHRLRGHHKRYRKDLTKCTVKDIETMCEPCHKEHHRKKNAERKFRRRIRRKMSRTEYVFAAFGEKPTKTMIQRITHDDQQPNTNPAQPVH